MSPTIYGPDQTWPAHQKAYWRDALKQAHAAGWTLKHLGSPHWFGVVVCPAEEHSFSVDSTARGAETKAKEVPKLLRACRHGPRPRPVSATVARQESCKRLLARADELIDRAAGDLCLARALVAALGDRDAIELMLDAADANLDEVMAFHEEASDRAAELEDAPGPDVIALTLAEAEAAVEEAAGLAGKIRRPTVARPLRTRTGDARSRIARLRCELDAIDGV